MKNRSLITITVLLLTWAGTTLATSYRWVDENGVTIYSQSPPPSGKAAIVKAPPPSPSKPGETMEKLKAKLNVLSEKKKKEQTAKQKEKEASKNAETCQAAKEYLAHLKQAGRIKTKMDDGNYKILSEEEKTAKMDKTRAAIKKYCK